ncbi:MAG: hypothetical protein PHU86_04225 [Patescibacteria group bacterium]|jgi:hypothetical protein|nr:hypothetical protein [Patescibacteria group bacterium]
MFDDEATEEVQPEEELAKKPEFGLEEAGENAAPGMEVDPEAEASEEPEEEV